MLAELTKLTPKLLKISEKMDGLKSRVKALKSGLQEERKERKKIKNGRNFSGTKIGVRQSDRHTSICFPSCSKHDTIANSPAPVSKKNQNVTQSPDKVVHRSWDNLYF